MMKTIRAISSEDIHDIVRNRIEPVDLMLTDADIEAILLYARKAADEEVAKQPESHIPAATRRSYQLAYFIAKRKRAISDGAKQQPPALTQ